MTRWINRLNGSFLQMLMAALIIGAAGPFASIAEAQMAPVKVEWLGWSFYRFTSPTGKVILTNGAPTLIQYLMRSA